MRLGLSLGQRVAPGYEVVEVKKVESRSDWEEVELLVPCSFLLGRFRGLRGLVCPPLQDAYPGRAGLGLLWEGSQLCWAQRPVFQDPPPFLLLVAFLFLRGWNWPGCQSPSKFTYLGQVYLLTVISNYQLATTQSHLERENLNSGIF